MIQIYPTIVVVGLILAGCMLYYDIKNGVDVTIDDLLHGLLIFVPIVNIAFLIAMLWTSVETIYKKSEDFRKKVLIKGNKNDLS